VEKELQLSIHSLLLEHLISKTTVQSYNIHSLQACFWNTWTSEVKHLVPNAKMFEW